MPAAMQPPLPKLYEKQHWSSPEAAGEAVSIIMRTKDRALLLPRALQSVLGQTFQDWRLYLVNDGGSVAALEACLAPYREAFGGRLEVIHHAESRGMEAASNAGLAKAQGEFFAIHDDDDAWHEDFLSRTVSFLNLNENRRYVGVATGCDVVQERIEAGNVVKIAQFPWVYFQPPVEFSAMLARNQMPPITLLLRRALLARIGDYNEALPVLGDWEFILRVLAAGDIGAIEESLAYYHHRLEAGQSAYANSVSGGLNIHRETKAALGNQIIRHALAAQPALLGVLWPVLQAVEAGVETQNRLAKAGAQGLARAMETNEARQAALGQSIEASIGQLAAAQADNARRLAALETHLQALAAHMEVVCHAAERQRRLQAPLRWLNRRLRGIKGAFSR